MFSSKIQEVFFMPLDHDENDYNKDYDTMIADTLQNG